MTAAAFEEGIFLSLVGSDCKAEVEVESAPRPDRLAVEARIMSRKPSSVRVATYNRKREQANDARARKE